MPAMVAAVGEDNLLFETDFPHPTCLFSDPVGTANDNLRELTPEARTKILGGNAVVILASEKAPLPAMTFAEVLATSDIPPGVVNILTGRRDELAPHFATHMDINALIDGSGDDDVLTAFREGTAENLKRTASHHLSPAAWSGSKAEDPYRILDTLETKTAWHPIGL